MIQLKSPPTLSNECGQHDMRVDDITPNDWHPLNEREEAGEYMRPAPQYQGVQTRMRVRDVMEHQVRAREHDQPVEIEVPLVEAPAPEAVPAPTDLVGGTVETPQIEVPVKRKPGRPRKVPLTTTHPVELRGHSPDVVRVEETPPEPVIRPVRVNLQRCKMPAHYKDLPTIIEEKPEEDLEGDGWGQVGRLRNAARQRCKPVRPPRTEQTVPSFNQSPIVITNDSEPLPEEVPELLGNRGLDPEAAARLAGDLDSDEGGPGLDEPEPDGAGLPDTDVSMED